MQATKNIPNSTGDIQPKIIPKTAIPVKNRMTARKTFLEQSGFKNRSTTITIAGLAKRIAGFQAINEPGNLAGKEPKTSANNRITTKDVIT
jgi:hypothetical protein